MKKFFAALIITISWYTAQGKTNTIALTPLKLETTMITNLLEEIDRMPSSPLNIPFWGKVRALSLATACAGLGNLLAYAAKNNRTIEKNYQTVSYTSTALGLLAGVYLAYKIESKQGISKKLHLPLIHAVLDWDNNPDIMRKKILRLFPCEKHPRLKAVHILEKNHEYLCALKEIFLKAQRNNKTYKAKDLQEHLESAIIGLEATLIIMKQDPVWIKQNELRQDKIKNAWINGIFVALVDLTLGK